MRKLKYETPELRIALTEAEIKANDLLKSLDEEHPGLEMPEEE